MKKSYFIGLLMLTSLFFCCSKTELEKTEKKIIDNYWIGEDDQKNLIVYNFNSDKKFNVYELFYCLADCSQWYEVVVFQGQQYKIYKYQYNWQWENETAKKAIITELETDNFVLEVNIVETTNNNLTIKIEDIESYLVLDNSFKKALENN